MHRFLRLSAVAVVTLLLTACSWKPSAYSPLSCSEAPTESVTRVIDQTGDTVPLPNHGYALIVPPNAVATQTNFILVVGHTQGIPVVGVLSRATDKLAADPVLSMGYSQCPTAPDKKHVIGELDLTKLRVSARGGIDDAVGKIVTGYQVKTILPENQLQEILSGSRFSGYAVASN